MSKFSTPMSKTSTLISDTLLLAKSLIEKASITPLDAGCQDLIAKRLETLGFIIHKQYFDQVQNLIAIRRGSQTNGPCFAFAGHTDVVPPGNLSDWHTLPFTPTIKDNYLYGRGAADMKGSLAAMITATERFIQHYPEHAGSILFLITSDEEGDAILGTRKIMEYLEEQSIVLDYCIVGEPTSHEKLGDTIKIGRRGSMTGHLKIMGKQGHVAYPHRAENPIHRILDPLNQLATRIWDEGNLDFPPTSFQISNINSGTGAGNVIPGILECLFNFRFSNEINETLLQEAVHKVLQQHQLSYQLDWQVFGQPFLTAPGVLINACKDAIYKVMGFHMQTSTDGGTSDARFIAGPKTQVIELGPCNATIHAVNECIHIEDLEKLSSIYEEILKTLFSLEL